MKSAAPRKIRRFLSGKLFPLALLLILAAGAFLFLAFRMSGALAPVAALERIFSVGVALFLVNSPLPSENRTARLLLLLLFPWLGAVCCLFLRSPSPSDSAFFSPRDGNGLSRAVFSVCGGSCRAASAEYLPSGKEMAERLLSDLSLADREIFLEYYILARGEFLDAVLSVLERKAREGVDVRVLYDDFGCALTLPRSFRKTLRARGVKVAVYHPLRPFPFSALNRRDHRKIAVIDGEIAYTGGINLADEYIGKLIRFGHWKDTAVRITGEPARRFKALFLSAWNHGKSTEKCDPSCVSAPNGIPCAVISDGAGGTRTGEEALLQMLSRAEKRIVLCTPYLAPTEPVFNALKGAARAGMDVRLMIPHIPDKRSVFALTRSEARRLMRFGVNVREYKAGFLHAKCVAADGKYAAVGSYNLDARSLRIQAECGIFFESEEMAHSIERDFGELWETGVPVPAASLAERCAAFLLRPLAHLL